ncbi:hypothetical protein RchiOBHm_Chr5g0084011 [Rosa chinensis]|uniref:Secreted protein n=1 Tax=Rosa chinensis TaxID=74649 RepID=A0A2P6QNQ4_ROSCH|nr:hypothetical protein RchiOBHm_Chr5g0084011 [Rosa chinensis]
MKGTVIGGVQAMLLQVLPLCLCLFCIKTTEYEIGVGLNTKYRITDLVWHTYSFQSAECSYLSDIRLLMLGRA